MDPQSAIQSYITLLWVIIIMLCICAILGMRKSITYPNQASIVYVLFWGVFFIVAFALRPIEAPPFSIGDTYNYALGYLHAADNVGVSKNEPLWGFLMLVMSRAGIPVEIWFGFVASIYIVCNIAGIHKLFPQKEFVPFVFFVTFFIFLPGGLNGIRNAAAYSLVFYAIILILDNQKIKIFIAIALMIMAINIHTSVVITITGFCAAYFLVKRTSLAVSIWIAMIFISLIGGNSLASVATTLFGDPRASSYLTAGQNSAAMSALFTHTGFRWDFLIFSALPIYIGWKVTESFGVKDRKYQILLNTYILANAIWIAFIYAAYSNRFAMLSWCLYPYVLCYPFIRIKVWEGNRSKYAQLCLLAMTAFTFLY